MSIKVKARINFNDIIEKLHKTAKRFADDKSGKKILLDNLAFNDKSGKFLGGGQYCIFMGQKEGEVTEKDKGKYIEVIKEYVHYFVGEEETKYISEDDLQPIYQGSTATEGEVAQEEQQRQKEKAKVQQDDIERRKKFAVYGPVGTYGQSNETLIFKDRNNRILKMLLEDAQEGEPKKTEEEEEEEEEEEQKEGEKKENIGKCIGYGIMYDIAIDGKADHTIKDAIENKATGLFGGVLADLRNIKIKIGGHPVNIGHIFDPKKWEEVIGLKDIDITQVAHDAKEAFDHDYRGNTLDISVQSKDWLISTLNRDKKITPEVKAKINKAPYSVLIQAKEKDPYYSKYDRKSIAKTVSKSFGTTYNAGIDWNSVNQDDVIKIDDVGNINIPKNKDEKDEKSTLNKLRELLDRDEKKQNKEEGKSKNKKLGESEEGESKKPQEEPKEGETKGTELIKKEEDKPVSKEEYLDGLKQNMKTEQTQDYSYEIKTMDEIVKFLKSGNYEGNIEEIQKYKMGCLIQQKGLNETRKLFIKIHPDSVTDEDEKKKRTILFDKFTVMWDEYTKNKDEKEIEKIFGSNTFNEFVKNFPSDNVEELEKELKEKGEGKKSGFDVRKFINVTNDILKRYQVKEISGIYPFKKMKVAAESIVRKDWKELLIESLFEDCGIFESAGNKGKGVGKQDIEEIIKKKGVENIRANTERMKVFIGNHYGSKSNKDKEIKQKCNELIDQFSKLNTEDEMLEFINGKFDEGGKDSKDSRSRTAFINSLAVLSGIPDKSETETPKEEPKNYPIQIKTEYPIAVSDGGKLVSKKDSQIISIEKEDIILVMPFNIPEEEEIKKIDREQLQIDNEQDNVEQKEQGKNSEDKEKIDWYIIPHKRIKNMDRHNERSTDSNGVTTTHTSNAEYKPKGK